MPTHLRYEEIGVGYSNSRQEEPMIRERIHRALGETGSIINVGAGAGSYEPKRRNLIAVEPSAVMVAQRPPGFAPAIRASATDLPFKSNAFELALSILSLHHWDDPEKGVLELKRVARRRVVILTYDAKVANQMWLAADYMPETAELDRQIFPDPERIGRWLGGQTEIEVIPIPRDCSDWMLGSFWAHPERVLDPQARAGTSGFARLGSKIEARIVSAVARDLESGIWDERYGTLRNFDAYDAGLRLITTTIGG